ncbi:hypothetical protein HYU13_04560 [Candidatus Woesearchaeota archaeon]|nr:hypothetical protein [Candidatus Woesearchaeota archaeon]
MAQTAQEAPSLEVRASLPVCFSPECLPENVDKELVIEGEALDLVSKFKWGLQYVTPIQRVRFYETLCVLAYQEFQRRGGTPNSQGKIVITPPDVADAYERLYSG